MSLIQIKARIRAIGCDRAVASVFQKDSSTMCVRACAVALLVVLLGPMIGTPASLAGSMTPKPDPAKGRALAERVCIACHVVARQAASTVAADVPSFQAIADKEGQTPESVAGRIVIPHPPMPAVALSREEIANVVAYIMTLRTTAP